MNFERIYLDNAATTALRPDVADAMRAASADGEYNPSSLHAEGRRARALLDAARERVASVLGAARSEIIFTSSGTEANNEALFGVARLLPRGAHFVTAGTEHLAVLEPLESLRRDGFEVTLVPVGPDGLVEPAAFAAALRPTTRLATVMYANNEIGTVQPIATLGRIAREQGVFFHTDAVQAPEWLSLDVNELEVDLLSLSAHKFGGPKGVGLLYVRRGVPIASILYGGSQEFGRRPGTENVVGIAGLATALELAVAERSAQCRRVGALRDRLEAGIRTGIDDVRINGARRSRLPNVSNVSFGGIDSAALLIALDLAGVAVAAGSACTSGVPGPSHVIAALGLEQHWCTGAIRFSLGRATSSDEIERVVAMLPAIMADLRRPVAQVGGGWVD